MRRPARISPGPRPAFSTHRADGEDRAFRRIDDGRELLDVEHPEVRDRERRAAHLRRAELAGAGALGEIARLTAIAAERFHVAVAEHRRDQPLVERHGDAEVRAMILADRLRGLGPGAVGA